LDNYYKRKIIGREAYYNLLKVSEK